MLARIQCVTTDAAGNPARTKLALSMHTMRGRRGDYLATAIRNKFAEGCDFRVSYGLIGYHTKQILGAPTARGRIPLRSTGLDYNTEDDFDLNKDGDDDLILDYYSHQKYFVIQGQYNGVPGTEMVLTGSSNWASLSTANDELWMTVRGARVAKKYVRNFNYQWDHARNSRDAYTTTYSTFRVQGRRRALDHRAPARHHDRARQLQQGPLLGVRLIGTPAAGDDLGCRHADRPARAARRRAAARRVAAVPGGGADPVHHPGPQAAPRPRRRRGRR